MQYENMFNMTYRKYFEKDWLFILSEYAYRREIPEAVGLPTIPVHPIGYFDAQKLLE